MSPEPTWQPPRAKTPVQRVRSYLESTLYAPPEPNSIVPPDQYKIPLVLELTTSGATWDEEDIYCARMPGADVRDALRRPDGGDYVPTVYGYYNSESRRIDPALGISASDGDTTANAASAAPINRKVLMQTPTVVTRTEAIPATMVRRLVEVELAALDPALAQACVDIGMRVPATTLARRRCCEDRQVRRVNREALDALLSMCFRYLSDRDSSRNSSAKAR